MDAKKFDLGINNTEGENVKPFGNSDLYGYMLGDLGNSLLFNLIGSYLLLFYTDVLGIGAAAVGTLMVVARIWDAINDPMMGVLIDRSKPNKNGKFRPYLMRAAIPVGLMAVLCFTVIPGISDSFKLPYAYITYIGFGMAYTAINIPYGSLASVMTSDPVERTSLSTFRSIGAILANLILMGVAPKLVFADGGASAAGFLKAAVIFAVISNICYFLAFKMTTERIQHNVNDESKEKVSLGKSVSMLFKNRALVGIMVASFGLLLAMFLPQSLNPYLYKDYFGNANLVGPASLLSMIPSFLVIPFGGKLVAKYGKKEVTAAGFAIATIGYGLLFFLPITNPYIFIAINCFAGIGTGLINLLVWALVGDAIDYQEYITGKREEGIVYAAYSLVRKLSQAVVGGVSGFALGIIGYQSGAAQQTAEVANGVKNIITAVPFFGVILGLLAMIFIYNLTKSRLEEVNNELKVRRSN